MTPVPRTITLSLVEALTVLQLKELKSEVTAVIAGSLLVVAAWVLFS